jgi:hypothetical protein
VSVVAGGTFGYAGDYALATKAALAYPYGVSVDAQGNIFIAGKNMCHPPQVACKVPVMLDDMLSSVST